MTFRNSAFCPQTISACFAQFSWQTATTSLHSIKWLVFMTETECVYCQSCHGSGSQSPASHRSGPGSIPGQSMWDSWWKNWNYDIIYKLTCYHVQWCTAKSSINMRCDRHMVDCFQLQCFYSRPVTGMLHMLYKLQKKESGVRCPIVFTVQGPMVIAHQAGNTILKQHTALMHITATCFRLKINKTSSDQQWKISTGILWYYHNVLTLQRGGI